VSIRLKPGQSDRDWYEQYKDLIPLEASDIKLQGHIMHLFPLIHAIKRQALAFAKEGQAPSFLEIGSGTAVVSKLLHKTYPKSGIYVVDNDSRITQSLRDSFPDFNVYLDEAEDMKFSTHVNVIHHQGLLEHFTEVRIRNMLQAHAKLAQSIVFAVPVKGYPQSDVEEELRLPVNAWCDIVKDAGLTLLEYGEFGINVGCNEAYFVCHP